ncbi:MAG: DUF5367 family protein [Chryseolinea sp.]
MSVVRAMIAGATVWLLVITTFTILTHVPRIQESVPNQSLIVIFMMAMYSFAGSWIYYRNVDADHGIRVGIMASATALLLDVFVTVPFFEIPNGGGYIQFFTSPVLWVLVAINVVTFYVFGKRRMIS